MDPPQPFIVRASEVGICLLFCTAPLLSRFPTWSADSLLLLGLALLFWAGLYPKTADSPHSPPVLERALAPGLLAWFTASAMSAPEIGKSVGSVALFAGCMLCAALARGAAAPGRSRRLAEVTVWGGAWVSALGIAEYYGLWTPAWPYPGRIVAAFANPNDLGIYLCALLPVGVTLLLSDLGPARKTAVEAATILIYTCLLMSGSRGAWWAGLCAGGVVVVGGWRVNLSEALSRNRGWVLTLLPALAGITVLYSVPNPFRTPTAISIPDRFLSSGEIAQGIARPGTVSSTSVGHRYLIWSAAGTMVAGRPILGVGPGLFGDVYPTFRDRLLLGTKTFERLDAKKRNENVLHAHNDYLQTGAEVGMPGLLLFIVLIGVWTIRAWRQTRGSDRAEDRLVRLGFLSAVAAVLIDALISYPLHIPAVAVLFWSFLGMAMGRPNPPTPFPEGEGGAG